MRGRLKVLLMAAVVGMTGGACGSVERLVGPEGGRADADGAVPAFDGGTPVMDSASAAADSTGRWGGGLGSGT